jgi:hypothetical protein
MSWCWGVGCTLPSSAVLYSCKVHVLYFRLYFRLYFGLYFRLYFCLHDAVHHTLLYVRVLPPMQ